MKQKIQKLIEDNKYNEMVEYLQQDEGYWLNNDIWETQKLGLKKLRNVNRLTFKETLSENIKIELKYLTLYSCKNKYSNFYDLINRISPLITKIANYTKTGRINLDSIYEIDNTKFLLYLINTENLSSTLSKAYVTKLKFLKKLLLELFDNTEETQKDIWNCLKISGVRKSATCNRRGYTINFLEYPEYYRTCMKKYFRTIITKKSLDHCLNVHSSIVSFFENFKEMGYKGNFLRNLSREDIEKYVSNLNNKYKGKKCNVCKQTFIISKNVFGIYTNCKL